MMFNKSTDIMRIIIFYNYNRQKIFLEANYVVFHMPDLHKYLDDDITKVPGQVWISWNMECEENHLWMKDPEITQLFDITMDYHLASDIPYLYHRRFKEKLMQQQNPLEKQNKICMFISSLFNQSARQEYILELMKYVEIDSYGAWLNNKTLMEDSGRSTKLNIYSKYKLLSLLRMPYIRIM